MSDIRLLGLRISVYTRIARLALAEKGVDYELDEVDIFADTGPPPDYLALNPFGTIPCLMHEDFSLYETAAITRYIDEAFSGPSLQPGQQKARARMNQIIGMLDSYTYRPMVWDVYVQRIVVPASGGEADEETIRGALPGLRIALQQLNQWSGGEIFMLGDSVSLADLHAYPMLRYFIETPEGKTMFESFPHLERWLERMQTRASVRSTSFHWDHETEDGF